MRNDSLPGTVTIVTGAGSGLGAATAHAFARAGSQVACLDVDASAASTVRDAIERDGGTSIAIACDVSDAFAVFDSIEQVVARFGRLDVAINCAAIDHTVAVADMTVDQWDHELAVNLRGPFLVAKAVIPVMRRQHGGHIINVASTAATRAWANAAAYHASKWGLVGFSRGLGVEGRQDNIRVTTIIPGGMRTHFFDRFASQGIPMPDSNNLQDPANVAAAILAAVRMPPESVLQEMIITPMHEPSWP